MARKLGSKQVHTDKVQSRNKKDGDSEKVKSNKTVRRLDKERITSEPKEKKSRGFLSIFSTKPKTASADDEYDESTTLPTEKRSRPVRKDRVVNADRATIETPVSRSSLNDGEKEILVRNQNHGKPSEKSFQKNYTQKSMQQYVFMYMTPKYFANALKFYNQNFNDITVLGTSAVTELTSVFSKKTICNALLLFVFYQNEVEHLYRFLKEIGLRNLDRRVITIFLVSRDGVDTSELTEDSELKKYISKAEPVVLDELHPLTSSILERAMSGVVQNQPVYKEEVQVKQPKKVVVKETPMSKIYKVDIKQIQQRVEEMKHNLNTSEERSKLINKVLAAKTEKELDTAILDVSHIKLLKDVEDELDVYLDKFQDKGCLRSELEEVAENKLLLSALRTAEIKNLMENIIERAKQRLDAQDAMRDEFNRAAEKELNDAKAEVNEMKMKRAEILADLNQRCMEYKGYVQLITNSYAIEERCEVEEVNALCGLIENVKGKISTSNVSVITDFTKKLRMEIDRNIEAKSRTQDRLINMLNYQKSIFKDMKALLEVDTVLIKKLSDIISEYEENQEIKRYTETKLQAIGVNIIALDNSGFDTMFRMIGSSKDLFVYIGGKCQVISKNEFTLDEFLDSGWEPVEEPVIYITPEDYINEFRDGRYLERVFNKLDYYAKEYNNIYIVTRVASGETNIDNSLTLSMIGKIGNIVYFTSPENNKAVVINQLHQSILKRVDSNNIYSVKMVINKTPKDFTKDSKHNFKVLTNIKCKDSCISYKEDIEHTISEKVLQKLKGLKQSIR